MQAPLDILRHLVAGMAQPVEGQGRVGREIRIGMLVAGDEIGHAAIGRLEFGGAGEDLVGQGLITRPLHAVGDVDLQGLVLRRHHPAGEQLLPAGIGIVAHVAEGAFEIADHRRADADA